jgi:hypothetical protein
MAVSTYYGQSYDQYSMRDNRTITPDWLRGRPRDDPAFMAWEQEVYVRKLHGQEQMMNAARGMGEIKPLDDKPKQDKGNLLLLLENVI